MKHEIKTLSGVTTILAHMPESTSVTVEILVKAGSIYENKENNGISHFLEHMFFKGGKKYKNSHDVSATIDAFGGEFNAFTGEEYAGYYVKSAPQFTHKALEILSDMLVHAQFPKEEMEKEKNVVIQEIMMYEDRPDQLVMEKWKKYFYGDNSFGRSILGPVENIKNMKQEDLFAHKENLYTKDNLVIIVAGNLKNQKEIEEHISELFAELPETKKHIQPKFQLHLPTNHEEHEDRKTQQNHVVISAQGFSMFDNERFAAKLLSTILGGNMSSRLFQNIREKHGLCYYIGASHYANEQEGLFFIRAGIEKARRDFALEAIYKEIENISKGDITEQEFIKARGYVEGSLQMGVETSNEMVDFLGSQYLLKGEIKSLDDMLKAYEKVTMEDIKQIGKKLARENLYMYYFV